MENNKKCSVCQLTKPLDAFSKNCCMASGYNSQCKACRSEYYRKNKPPVVQKGPVVPDGMKHCSKCGEVKNKDEFGARAQNLDGLHGHCHSCKRAYDLAYLASRRGANRPIKKVVAQPVAAGFKQCRSCHQELPVLQFSSHAKLRDGLENHCRTCRSERARTLMQRRVTPAVDPAQELQELQSLAQRHVEQLDESKAAENRKEVSDFAADLWEEVQYHFSMNPPLLPAHKLPGARARLDALVAGKTYVWWRMRFDGLKMGHWLELLVPGYRHYVINPFHDQVAA